MTFEDRELARYSLADGDLLVCEGGEVGRAAIWSAPISPCFYQKALHRLRAVDGMTLPRFMYYLLVMSAGIGVFRANGNPNTIDHLTAEAFRSYKFPWPPIEEQVRISLFLDDKTARIDGLIEKKRALLDRLTEKRQALITRAVTKGLNPDAPMKPSGIDWLGDIPAHWRLVPLKRLGQVRSGITKGKFYTNEETVVLPYLRVANVQDGWLDLKEIAEIEIRVADVHKYSLKHGDVLMNEGGDNDKLGRGTVWKLQISPCLHQNHVFAVRLGALDPEWIARCTEAAYAKFHFFRRAVQSTNLASISRTTVADLPIPLPSTDEIFRILEHLNSELDRLSMQIDKIDQTVGLLSEYRSAVITAAVTGQIPELR
ncbi:restriction endonuclease subunit S [Thioflavicoccus mobilis]|nr:restriction endonuclease subunit S [Thioflavicoccus mobilis]